MCKQFISHFVVQTKTILSTKQSFHGITHFLRALKLKPRVLQSVKGTVNSYCCLAAWLIDARSDGPSDLSLERLQRRHPSTCCCNDLSMMECDIQSSHFPRLAHKDGWFVDNALGAAETEGRKSSICYDKTGNKCQHCLGSSPPPPQSQVGIIAVRESISEVHYHKERGR